MTVTITCTSPSTDIYYTTDGSTPDDTKTEYNGPFVITETTTVKAAGFNGNDWSAVAEMTFTKKAAAPTGPGVTPVANATNEWTFTMPAGGVVLNVVYYSDQDYADDVAAAINAIGEVAYTPESKALIDAAREAYDALTPAQKALVSNSATLTTAETTYFEAEMLTLDFVINNYVLVNYIGAGGDIVIPNGVTSVWENAFYAGPSKDLVTSVVMPDSVTNIEANAFMECYNLTNVVFGTGVASIGEYAFCGCTNLTSANMWGTCGDRTCGDKYVLRQGWKWKTLH